MEWLEHEFKRSRRHGSPLWVLLLDVDEFKQVNDRYGHLSGDHMLAGIGSAIASILRSTDTAGRLGGDEFCVVVVEQSVEGTQILAERLRRLVQDTVRIRHEGEPHGATCSIGAAAFGASMETPAELLELADRALYRSKARGRNCVSIWGVTDQSSTSPSRTANRTKPAVL